MNTRLRAGLAIGLLILPAPGFAQGPSKAQADAIKQLCRSDYMAHCSGVPTGGSAALACLQQNAAQLSAPCQQALEAANPTPTSLPATPQPPQPSPAQRTQAGAPPQPSRRELAALQRACRADFRTFCSDIEPGGGRGLECLLAHRPQLSSPCRTTLADMRQAR